MKRSRYIERSERFVLHECKVLAKYSISPELAFLVKENEMIKKKK